MRDEDFSRLGAEITNLRLQELDLLSRPATPHFQQTIDDRVQIHFLISHGVPALTRQRKNKKRRKIIKQRRLATRSVGRSMTDDAVPINYQNETQG